jgi:hypothetical protein
MFVQKIYFLKFIFYEIMLKNMIVPGTEQIIIYYNKCALHAV